MKVVTVPGNLESPVSAGPVRRRRNPTPPVGMGVKIEFICPGGEWSPRHVFRCGSRTPANVLQRVPSDVRRVDCATLHGR